MPQRTSARDRINTNAVWSIVVFVLNVLAFLMMGLQARAIVAQLSDIALTHAFAFAGLVLLTVIVVRFAWVLSYGLIIRKFWRRLQPQLKGTGAPQFRVGVLVSWCGMRGLVTLATAFALPPEFPRRNIIVLSAFTVVLGTLIVQGFTIRPLIACLKIPKDESLDQEVATTRAAMLAAGLTALEDETGVVADEVRAEMTLARSQNVGRERPTTAYDVLRRRALASQRELLNSWRQEGRILDDAYHHLEDELDRAELDVFSPGTSWLQD
jgi:CPA1 family monovalent cation:H+ antiporter